MQRPKPIMEPGDLRHLGEDRGVGPLSKRPADLLRGDTREFLEAALVSLRGSLLREPAAASLDDFRDKPAAYTDLRRADRWHVDLLKLVEDPVCRIRRLDVDDRLAQALALRRQALAHVLLAKPAYPGETVRQLLGIGHRLAGTILLADEVAVGDRHGGA